jgi:hypothetical protein
MSSLRPCECGCGELARKRFVKGHALRVASIRNLGGLAATPVTLTCPICGTVEETTLGRRGKRQTCGSRECTKALIGRRNTERAAAVGSRATGSMYPSLRLPEHPRSGAGGHVREHIVIAERVLGKPLPAGAQVHHVNEDKMDNRPCNLVICEDQAYHQLLHRRMRALRACGNANWRKCSICKQWDAPENLYIPTRGHPIAHRACRARKAADRRAGVIVGSGILGQPREAAQHEGQWPADMVEIAHTWKMPA